MLSEHFVANSQGTVMKLDSYMYIKHAWMLLVHQPTAVMPSLSISEYSVSPSNTLRMVPPSSMSTILLYLWEKLIEGSDQFLVVSFFSWLSEATICVDTSHNVVQLWSSEDAFVNIST